MSGYRILVPMFVLLPVCGFAAPAPVSSAAADLWFDRARADIAAVHGEPPVRERLQEADLAIMLGQNRLNEADRALLRAVYEGLSTRIPEGWTAAQSRFYLLESGARIHHLLGAAHLAEQELAEALAMLKGTPDQLFGWAVAEIYAEWGDYNAAVTTAQQYPVLAFLAHTHEPYLCVAPAFASGGRRDMSDKAIRVATEIVTSPKGTTLIDPKARDPFADVGDPESTRALGLRDVSKVLAELGDFAAAQRLASTIDVRWVRLDAFSELARRAAKVGDASLSHAALGKALKASESAYDNADTAILAAELADREVFLAAATAAEPRAAEDPKFAALRGPGLARGYVSIVKGREAFDRITAVAERSIPELKDDDHPLDARLDLAAAYASVGDHRRVNRLLGTSSPADLSNSETFGLIPLAYAESGDFSRAITIIEQHLAPEERSIYFSDVARCAARRGSFDDAIRCAQKLPKEANGRIIIFRFIARAQAKAGQLAAAAKWIDALDSPRVRAAIELGAAEQLAGRRYYSHSRLFYDLFK